MESVLRTVNLYTLLGTPTNAQTQHIQYLIQLHAKAKLLPQTVLAAAEHYLLDEAIRKQYNAYLHQNANELSGRSMADVDAYASLGISHLSSQQDIALQLQAKWELLPQQEWLLIRKWLLHPKLREQYDEHWQKHFSEEARSVQVNEADKAALSEIEVANTASTTDNQSATKPWWWWVTLAGVGLGTATVSTPLWWPQKNFPPHLVQYLPPVNVSSASLTQSTYINITAVGDMVLGSHLGSEHEGTLPHYHKRYGASYFVRNVTNVLAQDDLSIANLEAPLTVATEAADKQFVFKGDPQLVNILKDGSIEAVNVANNHSHDYGEAGFQETLSVLAKHGVAAFGYQKHRIIEVKGKRIGLAGAKGWDLESGKRAIDEAWAFFNQDEVGRIDYHIMSFHWGAESVHAQNQTQQMLGRYAIERGFNTVLGHHPHVVQGIEHYQNGVIVYSLANFIFGGNKNPTDKDSLAVQLQLQFEGDQLVATDVLPLPLFVSSHEKQHNYRPMWANESSRERIIRKMQPYSNVDVRLGKRIIYELDENQAIQPLSQQEQNWCDDSLSVRATVFGYGQERFTECQPRQRPVTWG